MRLDSVIQTGCALGAPPRFLASCFAVPWRASASFALLMGISAVLSGVERLLAPRQRMGKAAVAAEPLPRARDHYFTIRQTRSEVGFVYWVLQGFGCYESFTLLDTWQEAIDEANRRLASVPEKVTVLSAEYAADSGLLKAS